MIHFASRQPRWLRAGALALGAALFAATLSTSSPADAQIRRYTSEDPSLTAVYGRGVHAYFGGRLGEADQLLSQAINAGSRDPRTFYFRGITRLRMGRRYEAQLDMQVGAALEARNPSRRRSINRALVRVQGGDRKMLENYRRDARLQDAREQRQLATQRYGDSAGAGSRSDTARRPSRVSMEELLGNPSVRVVRPSDPAQPAALEAPILQPATTGPQVAESPAVGQPDVPAAVEPAAVPLTEETVEIESNAAQDEQGDSPFGFEPPAADQPLAEPTDPQPELTFDDPAPLEADAPFGDASASEDAADDAADDAFGGFPEPEPLPASETDADDTGIDDTGTDDTETDDTATDDTDAEELEFDEIEFDEPEAPTAETDADPFADAAEPVEDESADQPAAPPSAVAGDQANPKKFLGVLGRIVGSAAPRIPTPELPGLPPIAPPETAGPQPDDFDFGPDVEFGNAEDGLADMPEEEPDAAPADDQPLPEAEVEEDPFGDDPFGGFGVEEDESPAEVDEADESAPEETEEAEETAAEESADESSADSDEAPAEDQSEAESESETDDNPLEDDEDPFGGFGNF